MQPFMLLSRGPGCKKSHRQGRSRTRRRRLRVTWLTISRNLDVRWLPELTHLSEEFLAGEVCVGSSSHQSH